jgi:hypothetical protein
MVNKLGMKFFYMNILLLSPVGISAQTCCVSLSEITTDKLLSLVFVAQSIPNISCVHPLYWTPCAQSSCLLVECVGKLGALTGDVRVHAGFCGPDSTAATATALLSSFGATGTCTQRQGIFNSTGGIQAATPPPSPATQTAAKSSSASTLNVLNLAWLVFTICCSAAIM